MRVFISYHDFDTAARVKNALNQRRPADSFYLAKQSNIAGEYWLPRIGQELRDADAFLFLADREIGSWQYIEYYEAFRLRHETGRPSLVPVVMGDNAPGLPFFHQLHLIHAPDPLKSLAAIDRELNNVAPADPTPVWKRFQPYKGMFALDEEDAAFFFGREEKTAEILRLMVEKPNRIVVLFGNSGVGKSSLARAGVLAALRSQRWPLPEGAWPQALRESQSFPFRVIRPGSQPLKALARSFSSLYCGTPAELEREANQWVENFKDGSTLHDLLEATKQRVARELDAEAPRRFVVYIDQGEELYAGVDQGGIQPNAQGECFSELLAEAATNSSSQFSVLLSLRADHYDDYQRDRKLYDASEPVDVLALRHEALCEVIRKPAETLGVQFEAESIVTLIAADTESRGALPLLSDVMHEMCSMQKRDDGILRWRDSQGIIDVSRPLQDRAGLFLAQHHAEEQIIKRLFTLLTRVPRQGAPLRRQLRRDECTEEDWELVEALADERWRLVSLLRSADDTPAAEVAHEQLLRNWPTLDAWIEEQREFVVWLGEAEAAAADWENAEGDMGLLLTGGKLQIARRWHESDAKVPPRLSKFIQASMDDDNYRREAERRRRSDVIAASILAFVSVLSVVSFDGAYNKQMAAYDKQLAQKNGDLAAINQSQSAAFAKQAADLEIELSVLKTLRNLYEQCQAKITPVRTNGTHQMELEPEQVP